MHDNAAANKFVHKLMNGSHPVLILKSANIPPKRDGSIAEDKLVISSSNLPIMRRRFFDFIVRTSLRPLPF